MSKSYSDVRQIMGDEQKTTQQKATDIAHYVQVRGDSCHLGITKINVTRAVRQSIIQPELDKAQALLFKKKASRYPLQMYTLLFRLI
jgi:hypothetical protein